eukprot:m51a1_g9587 hypothetical protein (312) ;mRNA; r:1007174-1014648
MATSIARRLAQSGTQWTARDSTRCLARRPVCARASLWNRSRSPAGSRRAAAAGPVARDYEDIIAGTGGLVHKVARVLRLERAQPPFLDQFAQHRGWARLTPEYLRRAHVNVMRAWGRPVAPAEYAGIWCGIDETRQRHNRWAYSVAIEAAVPPWEHLSLVVSADEEHRGICGLAAARVHAQDGDRMFVGDVCIEHIRHDHRTTDWEVNTLTRAQALRHTESAAVAVIVRKPPTPSWGPRPDCDAVQAAADRVFFDVGVLTLLYFTDEHTSAIYVPLFVLHTMGRLVRLHTESQAVHHVSVREQSASTHHHE